MLKRYWKGAVSAFFYGRLIYQLSKLIIILSHQLNLISLSCQMKKLHICLFFWMLAAGQSLLAQVPTDKPALAQMPGDKKDTITLNLKKINGIGPAGFSSMGISSKDALPENDSELKYYTLKNIPANITNVKEYVYPLNRFQFIFQKYLEGKIDRSYFLEEATANGWKLADTLKLTRKPIKCMVAFITGLDEHKNDIYVLDADNNNDLANDTPVRLLKAPMNEDQIVSGANKLQVDYVADNQINHTTMLVNITLPGFGNNVNQLIDLSFPEFAYRKFSIDGQPYILCSSGYQNKPFIIVTPDRPFFVGTSSSHRIKAGEFFRVDGADFKLLSLNPYTGQVKLLTDRSNNIIINQEVPLLSNRPKRRINSNSKIVSTSVGYLAPLVKGININTAQSKGLQISTTALKGKYVYLDFWGTFCAPCIAELPDIKEAYLKFKDKFEVIGILDERDMVVAHKLLQTHQVIWPNISMNSKSTNISGYGKILSFPTSYLLDPNGKIIATNLRGAEIMAKLSEMIK